jgi:hypothetical protein
METVIGLPVTNKNPELIKNKSPASAGLSCIKRFY